MYGYSDYTGTVYLKIFKKKLYVLDKLEFFLLFLFYIQDDQEIPRMSPPPFQTPGVMVLSYSLAYIS